MLAHIGLGLSRDLGIRCRFTLQSFWDEVHITNSMCLYGVAPTQVADLFARKLGSSESGVVKKTRGNEGLDAALRILATAQSHTMDQPTHCKLAALLRITTIQEKGCLKGTAPEIFEAYLMNQEVDVQRTGLATSGHPFSGSCPRRVFKQAA